MKTLKEIYKKECIESAKALNGEEQQKELDLINKDDDYITYWLNIKCFEQLLNSRFAKVTLEQLQCYISIIKIEIIDWDLNFLVENELQDAFNQNMEQTIIEFDFDNNVERVKRNFAYVLARYSKSIRHGLLLDMIDYIINKKVDSREELSKWFDKRLKTLRF